MNTVSAHDVAAYILQHRTSMTAMKLQKLVYYAQAWSLVWEEDRLFSEPIEAWANGPVVYALYDVHRGRFKVRHPWPKGDPSVLSSDQRDTVDLVLDQYGGKPSQWLSDLTHREPPWKNARRGLSPGDRGNREILLSDMAEYYASLLE